MQIRIRSLAFTIPTRFFPGHVLTEAEALALNGTLAENIRNNVDQWVRGDEGPAERQALEARVLAYAEGYRFSGRPRATSHSPLEKMAEQVVLERWGGLRPEALREALARPEVQQEAARRLAAEAQVARDFLQELPLG